MKASVYSTLIIFVFFAFWQKNSVFADNSHFRSGDFILDYSTISTGATENRSSDFTLKSGDLVIGTNGDSENFSLRTINVINSEVLVEDIDQPEFQNAKDPNISGSIFKILKDKEEKEEEKKLYLTKQIFKEENTFNNIVPRLERSSLKHVLADNKTFYLANQVTENFSKRSNLMFLNFDYLNQMGGLSFVRKDFKAFYLFDLSSYFLMTICEYFFGDEHSDFVPFISLIFKK